MNSSLASNEERLTFRIGLLGAFVAPIVFLLGAVVHFVYFRTFDMTALTMSALVGLIIAALFAKNYQQFWDKAISGMASSIAVTVVLILFTVGPLASLLESTGVSEGFVWLAAELGVSGGLFIAVVFVATCAMSISTGTSLGTMFTAFPIFYPAGAALDAHAMLLAGAIFSGAMFGDNMAPISDTTIVSSSTQKYRRRAGTADVAGVVASRAKYALSSGAICLVLFLVIGSLWSGAGAAGGEAMAEASPGGLIMIIPVIVLIAVAFWKRNLYLAITTGLIVGTVTALIAGILPPDGIVSVEDGEPAGFLFEGVNDMLPLVGLTIAVFGVIGVLRGAGVFDLIIEKLSAASWASGPRGAEVAIGVGQAVTTALFAGVVGPSIVTFGPVADEIGSRAGLHPYRRANVLEGFGMGFAAMVPVLSAFLFIISQLTTGHDGMPALTPLEVAPFAFYPIVLNLVMIFSIVTGWGRKFESASGAPSKEGGDKLGSK